MKEKVIFKPRARILLQLGEQLIRNESIALLELVKNSYDADASTVKVIMRNVDDPESGVIIIEDDGCGMTLDIIKNVWMVPGSDYKEKLVREKRRTSKFGRLPLGEKGIGRFAVHKLGDVVEIITRAENNPEIYLQIDWTAFEKAGYLKRSFQGKQQQIQLTNKGKEVLQQAYMDLSLLWQKYQKKKDGFLMRGVLQTGLGEGKYYMSLQGYKDKLSKILGWVPYPGTLNLKLREEKDFHMLAYLLEQKATRIGGFEHLSLIHI